MPIYEYLCNKGHSFDRYLKLDDYKEPQTCECGAKSVKQILPTMVNCDIQPWDSYISPASGKLITSYKERDADMKATGSADYDPGIRRENEKKKKQADVKLDKAIDSTVEEVFQKMPSKDKEKLTNELGRVDLDYTRI